MKFDFDNVLYISQIINTIQGEGPQLGSPCLLIRFSGCNLRCQFCDTKFTWNHSGNHCGQGTYTSDNIQDLYNIIESNDTAATTTHLMITGGEPLLYWNNPLFQTLITNLPHSTIEIETNGTLFSKINLVNFKKHITFNISPKILSREYLDLKEWENLEFSIESLYSKITNSSYGHQYTGVLKFIDIPEYRTQLLRFIDEIPGPSKIYMMPLTPDRKKYNRDEFLEIYHKNSLETLKFCLDHKFIFTPRLQIYLFDTEDEIR